MTRDEAEKRIHEHMLAIREIAQEYAPDDEYLTVSFIGEYMSANNSAAFKPEYDQSQRIDFSDFGNGKIQRVTG